ncbi:hypothetical protein [Halothermothrix orenii]|uniref:Uncharacterized protein n=1 Tax=Halothermothrix orenii (strain H 168 / OCM 544 / DSM 9562) TaxID=373903 RepID=B8D1N2_HALOH|nr:hypothetical protein [Halothermothrix orenii]ACL69109.1 hypothetical protein Hore_03480 [Halothermothrix orenii H 168]
MTGYEIINESEKIGYKLELRPGPKIGLSLKPGYNPDPQEAERLINKLKANKENVIEYLQLDDKAAFNKYIEELREQNRYDPRPDLSEDSELWQTVLKEAEKQDKQVYSNLHGCRCGGARLKTEKGQLKLIPAIGPDQFWKNKEEWDQDRKEFLLPYASDIKEIFIKVQRKCC